MPVYRESLIVRIDCDPPLLMWSGMGDLFVSADTVLPDDETAIGGGALVNVPDFQQLINGTAERLEITVSGVDEETARLALDDAPSVRGARVDVGTIRFTDEWQIDSVTWEALFEARSLTVSRPAAQPDGQVSRSISLTIVHGDTLRSRPKLAFFTDADQRRRSSDDAFFSHVGRINAGVSRRFGPL